MRQLEPLSPLDISDLLKRYGLRPDRRLGQNFIVAENAIQLIISAAEMPQNALVLEIGPGLGSLTRHLARNVRQVIAVEKDARLMPVLASVMRGYENFDLVQGDILQVDLEKLGLIPPFYVVANIPYYITSAVIRRLLDTPFTPVRIVLTVQKEVAERICASPGDMSLLALSVQVYGKPEIYANIPAGAFYPIPKVDSAIVRIELGEHPNISDDRRGPFFRLAKAGFSQKRKNLRNAIAGGLGWKPERVDALLLASGIEPSRRAETLSLEEWVFLVNQYLDLPDG